MASKAPRSPKTKAPARSGNTPIDQTQSVPNISQAVCEPEFVNATIRSKRPRLNESPSSQSQLEDFKQELKCEITDMLSSWKDTNVLNLIAEQSGLINKLIADMAELKSQNSQIQKTNKDIEKSITFVCDQYDNLKNQVNRLQSECLEHKKYAETLEKSISDLQHKSRSSSIEVRNIPNQDIESTADLTKLVTDIARTWPASAHPPKIIYRSPYQIPCCNFVE
ncbi:unnamed protein product [Arctia plantaginis]|uniref:Uncharacterized protein n=1 Tax=Arctia plantaginis TaxID=874455 RepID=A0A8S1AMH0_ARCPL|nr:unnamed protein product [Arctia plantaginis]